MAEDGGPQVVDFDRYKSADLEVVKEVVNWMGLPEPSNADLAAAGRVTANRGHATQSAVQG